MISKQADIQRVQNGVNVYSQNNQQTRKHEQIRKERLRQPRPFVYHETLTSSEGEREISRPQLTFLLVPKLPNQALHLVLGILERLIH